MKQRGDSVGIIVESGQDIGAAQKSDLVFAFQGSADACKEVTLFTSLAASHCCSRLRRFSR